MMTMGDCSIAATWNLMTAHFCKKNLGMMNISIQRDARLNLADSAVLFAESPPECCGVRMCARRIISIRQCPQYKYLKACMFDYLFVWITFLRYLGWSSYDYYSLSRPLRILNNLNWMITPYQNHFYRIVNLWSR